MKKQKYVLLEHKADALFEARGKSFEEAFENAAQAMFDTIADTKKLREEKTFKVEEKTAASLEQLVVFVLSDLLSESEARELMLKKIKVTEFSEEKKLLKAIAFGTDAKHEFGKTVVKAVTFHELSVKKEDGEWKIRILLDV